MTQQAMLAASGSGPPETSSLVSTPAACPAEARSWGSPRHVQVRSSFKSSLQVGGIRGRSPPTTTLSAWASREYVEKGFPRSDQTSNATTAQEYTCVEINQCVRLGQHRVDALRWIYGRALSEDPDATLDDLREAVTTLEDLAPTARRVLGGSYPLTTWIERDLQNARAALHSSEAPPPGTGTP